MSNWQTYLFTHWKSTAQGFLSFISVSAMSVAGWLTLQVALDPGWAKSKSYIYVAGGAALAGALAKAWLGMFQKDAGTVMAQLPGQAPEAMPGHPVPDNPAATAVVKQP